MTPRTADPEIHEAVVTAAARLLADGGRSALTTRRLATEVGTSTMAIYTRFGSLDGVHQAVREHGFGRLTTALDAVSETRDPVADLAAIGQAYLAFALANSHLYQAMFAEPPADRDDAGGGAFGQIESAVRRCIARGRFGSAEDPWPDGWAAEIWIAIHGVVTLALADVQPAERLRFLLADLIYRLAVGYGDQPDAARRSTGVERPGQ